MATRLKTFITQADASGRGLLIKCENDVVAKEITQFVLGSSLKVSVFKSSYLGSYMRGRKRGYVDAAEFGFSTSLLMRELLLCPYVPYLTRQEKIERQLSDDAQNSPTL